MSNDFHERFDISVDLGAERKRFIVAIKNLFLAHKLSAYERGKSTEFPDDKVAQELAIHFGRPYAPKYHAVDYIPADFLGCLEALEVIYETCYVQNQQLLAKWIDRLMRKSRVDLEVRFRGGTFYREGSELLDKKLVKDVLNCIDQPEHSSILEPFSRGLGAYLESIHDKDRLKDVVEDMYEASEAYARIVLGNSKTLSANKERLISKLELNEYYKRIYSEYVDYTCAFRHAIREESPRPELKHSEVESLIYLTGLLIRLGMKS